MASVILYKNNSDSIVVNKSLNKVAEFTNVRFTDDVDIVKPIMIIKGSEAVLNSNYLYCPELKRYYYITSVNITSGDMCEVLCDVDVLMSFKNDILNSTQNIVRQANDYQQYMKDGKVQTRCEVLPVLKYFNPPKDGWILESDINDTAYTFVLNAM